MFTVVQTGELIRLKFTNKIVSINKPRKYLVEKGVFSKISKTEN